MGTNRPLATDFAVTLRQMRAALSRHEWRLASAQRILTLIPLVDDDVLVGVDITKFGGAVAEMGRGLALIQEATEAVLTIKIPTYPPIPELDAVLLRLQSATGEGLDVAFTDFGALVARLRPEDVPTRLSAAELSQVARFLDGLAQGVALRDHAFDSAAAALANTGILKP